MPVECAGNCSIRPRSKTAAHAAKRLKWFAVGPNARYANCEWLGMPTQRFRSLGVLASVAVLFLMIAGRADGATVTVPAAGDLHAALLTARTGDVIALEPGATYVGNFTLPEKDGSDFITIRTGGAEAIPEGQRV